MSTEITSREFRMAPELRRSATSWTTGWLLILLPTAIVLRARLFGFQWLPSVGATIACIAMGTPPLLALRWRLRVDQEGIASRWFRSWDV